MSSPGLGRTLPRLEVWGLQPVVLTQGVGGLEELTIEKGERLVSVGADGSKGRYAVCCCVDVANVGLDANRC